MSDATKPQSPNESSLGDFVRRRTRQQLHRIARKLPEGRARGLLGRAVTAGAMLTVSAVTWVERLPWPTLRRSRGIDEMTRRADRTPDA